jgi:hypothetical protein
MRAAKRIPLWLKLAYTAWMAVWVPSYAAFLGPQNFLWLCDLGNFIVLAAFWTESSLLFSTQLVAALLIDLLWCVDVASVLATGSHLIGGTEYMFDSSLPLPIRLLSLFHVFTPPILVYAVLRLGYDRRGLVVQTVLSWLVFLLCVFVTDPERNINWAFGPAVKLPWDLDLWANRLLMMTVYPLLIYLPAHLLVVRILPLRPASSRGTPKRAQ